MVSHDEGWSKWAQLNYVYIENTQITPLTIKLPSKIRRAAAQLAKPPIIMLSRLRKGSHD